MIKAYVENGLFEIKGTFDFGYIGLYKDDQIAVNCTCSNVRLEWYDLLSKVMDIETCTDEEIAEFITENLNEAERKIQSNIRYINDEFLDRVYDHMYAVGSEFWEHEELRIPEFNYDDPDFDFYSFPQDGTNNDFEHFGLKIPTENSYHHEDGTEAYLRTYKPMFNLDNFIKGIEPDYISFHGDCISFQLSDKFGRSILSCAYDLLELDDLCFIDWHNG